MRVILGIENQTDIHYAMPVRNAIYDVLQYGKQVSDVAALHRRNRKLRGRGEFFSGFRKNQVLWRSKKVNCICPKKSADEDRAGRPAGHKNDYQNPIKNTRAGGKD